MELMFNELSINPVAADKYSASTKMIEFAKTAAEARCHNFMRIRSDCATNDICLSENYTMYDWLFDRDFARTNRTYHDFLQGMFVKPFINEHDEDIENQFVLDRYTFEGAKCFGLAAADLYDTLSISFQNDAKWTKNSFLISIEPDAGEIYTKKIQNVFSKECFSVDEIHNYIAKISPIILEETPILPADKKISISSHHGTPELWEFWNKLKTSHFVIEGWSTSWGGNKFIRKIDHTGIVELVLINTEKRYALKVQTTGRNYHENKKIAEELKINYA
ncbi:MAG: hypothetical protein Ta2B_10350 [Termitinemataceae bacterium]|nr:MAG: hypothetical protein Ta2B_10350 [Termitinemataceae bacterium]